MNIIFNFSHFHEHIFSEAAVRRCSSKQVFLKISQYSELKRGPTTGFSRKKQPPGGVLKKGVLFCQLMFNRLIDFLVLEEQLKMLGSDFMS